jgi:8-oxo-dGTP pyrophosphatase MutT (NUDIX family)
VFDLQKIACRVEEHSPHIIDASGNHQASVALILRGSNTGPQMFFIERAANKRDPWSGQIAFAGGNKELSDGGVLFTSIRETGEEVGLYLGQEECVGRLDDQQGQSNYRALPLVISCFVFSMSADQLSENNEEVADSFWIDLSHLTDSKNRIEYKTPYSEDPYPGVQLDSRRVLWGLTFRFVESFLQISNIRV